MKPRTFRLVLVFSAFTAGLVLFLAVFFLLTGQRYGGPPSAAAIGGPFNLVDQRGQPISDKDFRGKPFLVFFGFTHCPDVCPTTLFEVSEVFRALGPEADKAGALFVTVDPERDTPAAMNDYLSSFDSHLRGATGTRDQIDVIEKTYRVYARKVPNASGDGYTMDHTALVYLMDKNGAFVKPFSLKRAPAEAADELRRYF
jgi:protein SCO1/2